MQRQRGFTLVEVLVALSIMAMMAALAWLSSAVFFWRSNWASETLVITGA